LFVRKENLAFPEALPDTEQSEHLVPVTLRKFHNLLKVRYLILPIDASERQETHLSLSIGPVGKGG
jgi:hypothetical protein